MSTSSSTPDSGVRIEPEQSALGAFLAALVAFLAPGAALLATSTFPASLGGEAITNGEWIGAVAGCLVASAAGEARAARRVNVETRRGEATAMGLRQEGRPPEAGSSV